ncbi:MAG: hypothetical protein KAW41_04670 [Candidatus Diapherotrites archaeon]|nr:hypothetical protein [Candidatus Diapherotrites archaeon]
MTQTSKGAIGIEFVVATALFLAAYWFIYFQGALMLTPQLQRGDVRELAAEFHSSVLITDAGIPPNWSSGPSQLGFAEYSNGSVKPGVLNQTKLGWANGRNCTDLNTTMGGLEFAWRVKSKGGQWACLTSIPKEGVIKRPVFVLKGNSYQPGVMEVWAA